MSAQPSPLTLSVAAAAKLVGGGRIKAVAWLRSQGLVVPLGELGERVVVASLERRLAELAAPKPVRRSVERRPGDAV
jgi:hypothetical protein